MKKVISLFLILALFSLSGCVEVIKPTLWEFDGDMISIDEYNALLYSSLIPAKAQYTEEDWKAEKDGKSTFDQMKDAIYEDMLQIYTIAKMAKKEGMSADFSTVSSVKSSLVQSTGLSESEFIKEANITTHPEPNTYQQRGTRKENAYG